MPAVKPMFMQGGVESTIARTCPAPKIPATIHLLFRVNVDIAIELGRSSAYPAALSFSQMMTTLGALLGWSLLE
jgi:hypothetical protein